MHRQHCRLVGRFNVCNAAEVAAVDTVVAVVPALNTVKVNAALLSECVKSVRTITHTLSRLAIVVVVFVFVVIVVNANSTSFLTLTRDCNNLSPLTLLLSTSLSSSSSSSSSLSLWTSLLSSHNLKSSSNVLS